MFYDRNAEYKDWDVVDLWISVEIECSWDQKLTQQLITGKPENNINKSHLHKNITENSNNYGRNIAKCTENISKELWISLQS